MELVMDIIRMVMYLVMIGSGLIFIGTSIWYMKVFGPMMKPMIKMYSEMYNDEDEA